MEMEDQHPHPHHQQHEYAMSDLRQLMTNPSTDNFPGIPQAAVTELFPGLHHHRNLTPQQGHHHYEMLMMPQGLQDFNATRANNSTSNNNNYYNNNNTTTVAVTGSVSTPSFSGFEGEAAAASFGGDGGNGRWPRQETLTLLEIRSSLDSKFKEANQKGPLWDKVSRIMYEEYGYQRSGKKCREKFENLYKYYKKTKEGKAGRQNGQHYRFFRQLEALYGDSTSNSVSVTTITQATTHHQDQLTFPSSHKLCDSLITLSNNSDEFDSSSSDVNDLITMENDFSEKRKKKQRWRSWKGKIKEFIDSQMMKLMEKQESWLEKLTKTLEQNAQERVLRDEEWRNQEQARIDREKKFWAKERAWIEARDATLMEALQLKAQSPLMEEIMAAADHAVQNKEGGGNKKRKESNSRSSYGYFQSSEGFLYSQGTAYETARIQLNDSSSSPGAACNSNNVGNNNAVTVGDGCFRFLMADGDHFWENYGLKLSNGENQ